MKKIGFFIGLFLCLSISQVSAESLQIGLLANGNVVMVDVVALAKQSYGTIAAGGGISYDRGEYTIAEGLVALRNDQLLPGFRYGLGFKGLYGRVEEKDGLYHGTLASLGFLGEIAYELTGKVNPVNIPVQAYAALCFSPSSLCVDDTHRYQEYKGGMRFYLLENAFISVELKYRRIDFSDSVHGGWGRDDTILAGGLTLRL